MHEETLEHEDSLLEGSMQKQILQDVLKEDDLEDFVQETLVEDLEDEKSEALDDDLVSSCTLSFQDLHDNVIFDGDIGIFSWLDDGIVRDDYWSSFGLP